LIPKPYSKKEARMLAAEDAQQDELYDAVFTDDEQETRVVKT